jgi:ribonucleoside-triphosphate reductase
MVFEYTDFEKIEKEYIGDGDWEIKENANESRSYGNFLSYLLDKTLKQPSILEKIFPAEGVKKHVEGEIHIHKLPQSLHIPYCVGWSYTRLLQIGLRTPTLISSPPKHFDAAVNQLVNFIFLAAQEFSGAMAVSAFDLLTAPFVKNDNLTDKQIKQCLQSMLFELNYPSRMGFQSPFSNITICLDTSKAFSELDAIVGGKKVGRVSDYLDEAIRVVKQMILLYNEGDSRHSPFTFPIPTLMITKNFDWNDRRWDGLTSLIFENLAKRGTFYLLNGYVTDVDALYAMCCRLTIDVSKLQTNNHFVASLPEQKVLPQTHGTWVIPDATGSIGVITINLPRLAFLSKGEEGKFEEMLEKDLKIAKEVLMKMRERYERSLKAGLMPITKVYLGGFSNHYNTFGLVGLPEAASNFLRNFDLWKNLNEKEVLEAVSWMKKVISFVREKTEEFYRKDGILYNVEEVPAESTAYKMASADLRKFKDAFEKREFFIPMEDGVPYYSNCIIPYYAKFSIAERAKLEGEVQKEFTGGVMMHLFLHESVDPNALKKLVKKIVENTKVVYFSITPTISTCRHCGWNEVGIFEKCPNCGKNTEIWSRIVGYYRPISSWNVGKVAEFKQRVQYSQREIIE